MKSHILQIFLHYADFQAINQDAINQAINRDNSRSPLKPLSSHSIF